jgi:hypothetical protein
MTMSVSPLTFEDFVGRSLRAPAPPGSVGARLSALAKACATVILLAGIAVPTCCLDGSHHPGGALDGFGPICFSRALLR